MFIYNYIFAFFQLTCTYLNHYSYSHYSLIIGLHPSFLDSHYSTTVHFVHCITSCHTASFAPYAPSFTTLTRPLPLTTASFFGYLPVTRPAAASRSFVATVLRLVTSERGFTPRQLKENTNGYYKQL
jgi:hypothetical protein